MNLTEHDAYEDAGTENWPTPQSYTAPGAWSHYVMGLLILFALIGLADVVRAIYGAWT